MKSRTLLAMAVAGAFSCAAGAIAGSYEVQTPSSANESNPWLTARPPEPTPVLVMTAESIEHEVIIIDALPGTGASLDMGGAGTVGFDSAMTSDSTDYWKLDSES